VPSLPAKGALVTEHERIAGEVQALVDAHAPIVADAVAARLDALCVLVAAAERDADIATHLLTIRTDWEAQCLDHGARASGPGGVATHELTGEPRRNHDVIAAPSQPGLQIANGDSCP
jgi:hypothetical protein